MRYFQDKKKLRSRVYSGVVIAVLILLAFVLLKAVVHLYFKEVDSAEMRKLSEDRLAELNSRKQRLAAETGDLETQAGIEEEIRSKLSVAKPGEEVMVLVPADNASSTDATSTSWFGGIMLKIKGIFD